MSQLERFQFEEPKLLIFYLGGEVEGFSLEVHDIFFTIGKSYDEVVPKIKNKWAGIPESVHVDSWFSVENIDGYEIILSKEAHENSNKKLYFSNLGFYLDGEFGEFHRMKLVVADSIEEAKKLTRIKLGEEKILHVDDLYDIDNIIPIDQVEGYLISLKKTEKNKDIRPSSGYLKFH